MSASVVRISPPTAEPSAVNDDGHHTPAWTDYHQAISDAVAALPAQMRRGVTDGSDAAAGDVGEYLSATGGAVALTNNALANVVSLSLTAGDWDVEGNVGFNAGSGTHTFFGAGIGGLDTFSSATFPSVALFMGITTATRRYNVTATTTVWVVAEAVFTGTMTATGSVRARRAR